MEEGTKRETTKIAEFSQLVKYSVGSKEFVIRLTLAFRVEFYYSILLGSFNLFSFNCIRCLYLLFDLNLNNSVVDVFPC